MNIRGLFMNDSINPNIQFPHIFIWLYLFREFNLEFLELASFVVTKDEPQCH
jgi:hypothetical protein